MSAKKITFVSFTGDVTAATEKRLRAMGFVPVLRWVDFHSRSEKAYRTREALDRGAKKAAKQWAEYDARKKVRGE